MLLESRHAGSECMAEEASSLTPCPPTWKVVDRREALPLEVQLGSSSLPT